MIPKEAENFFHEKKNIIGILDNSIKAVRKDNYLMLKELSDKTIHSASIYQDHDCISIAVVIYSLSKVFERRKYREYKDWSLFYKTCLKSLTLAKENFQKERMDDYRKNLHEINVIIDGLESNLKEYIKEVFRKAMINKASRIYEHGISMQRTAELLGISQWELSEYAGRTGISDVNLSITMDIKIRIEKAIELFK